METSEKNLNLNYSIERNRNKRNVESVAISNKRSFERFQKLCNAEYYFRLYPYTHQHTKEAYFWIFAVKAKAPSFDFKLLVNEDLLNVVMGYISTGSLIDTTSIDPDDNEDFNNEFENFALELHKGEIAKGQKKVRHFSNISYSKYDYGMIIYKTEENEELRDFIDSTII